MRKNTIALTEDVIKPEEVERLRPYIPDIDEFLTKPVDDLVTEIMYVCVDYFDEEDELTPTSRMLERLMDELVDRTYEL